MNSGNMVQSLEFFFCCSFFSKLQQVLYKWIFFFRFSRILFNLARAFAECREALFLPLLTSLFITYLVITSRLAKEIIVVENVLNFGSKHLYEPWIKQLTNSNTKSRIFFHEIETHYPMNKRERLSCHLPYFLRTFSEPKFRSATSIPRDFRRIPNHQDWRQETRVVHLRWGKKLLEFYKAPVTKFWSNVVSTLKVT